jgi:hypothetical protein
MLPFYRSTETIPVESFRYGFEVDFVSATVSVDSSTSKRYRNRVEISTTNSITILDSTRGKEMGLIVEYADGRCLYIDRVTIQYDVDYNLSDNGIPLTTLTAVGYNTSYDIYFIDHSLLSEMLLLSQCKKYDAFNIDAIQFLVNVEQNGLITERLSSAPFFISLGDAPFSLFEEWTRTQRLDRLANTENNIERFSDATYSVTPLSLGRYKHVIRFTTAELPDYVRYAANNSTIINARMIDSTKRYAYTIRNAKISYSSANLVYTIEIYSTDSSNEFYKTVLS